MKAIKWCWIATEIKGGWRLKIAYGPRDYLVKGIVLKTPEEVERITNGNDGSIVFVHLKDTKFPIDTMAKAKKPAVKKVAKGAMKKGGKKC